MKIKSAPKSLENTAPITVPLPGSSGLLPILLALMTIAVFWPVIHNGFINFDDNVYVQSNAQVQQGLTLENVRWAFTHPISGNWHPVTMLSHMLDCQIYGLQPWGHHLTSLLFHALDTVLLFLLLHRLTGAVWRSVWVAAIFALHPVHVESVAWIAERKDVLSAFFGFLALLFYVRFVHRAAVQPETRPVSFLRSRDYWLACLCFMLGLMSKPMLVTWPFVLLLLDFWPLNRFQAGRLRPLLLEKIPFFTLATLFSLVAFLMQKAEGATQPLANLSFPMRSANAILSYGRYLLKMACPTDLAIFYPYPKVMVVSRVLFAVILLAGLSVLFWSQRRRYPFLLMGWLWFVGILVPVIGLVQVGAQSMADRYTYLPSVGVLILIAWGAYEIYRRCPGLVYLFSFLAIITIVLCGKMSRQQIAFWQNSEILFQHAVNVTTDNDIAQNNLAVAYYEEGRTNDAVQGLRKTLSINPLFAGTHMTLGNILAMQGLTNEALLELQQAVKLNPGYRDGHASLGILLFKEGQTDAGISQFVAAVHFRTNDPASFKALGSLLLEHGQTNAALSLLQLAVKTVPVDPERHYQLGIFYINLGQTDDAINEFQETIRLKPDFFEAHNNLASLLSKKGLVDQAIGELKESIRLESDYADAHYNLGTLYFKKGLGDEAAAEFQTVIRLSPDYAPAHYYLGNILIRKGQFAPASAQFKEAIRLQPEYALAHNKFGITLASLGHLPEAIAEFQEALRLKPDYAEAITNLAIALKLQAAGH